MANPVLIRPPVLNPDNQPSPSNPQNPSNVAGVVTNEALNTLVTGIVGRVLQNEGRQWVQSIINPNADGFSGTDQTISPEYRANLSELDKIPDVVRSLKDFTGQPGEFNSWKKSVDRILQLYDGIKGTPKYFGILSVIRNKIVGQADVVLESYNTPLDWKCIARCLTMHYADKRDLSTLEYQMTSLIQGNLTVQEFYHSVYSHLSLILNKIGCMEVSSESLTILTQTYRDKALDTFVRGLKGDLPRLLGIREPTDLPQALHLCLKLENQNYRTQYAISHSGPSRGSHNQIAPPPPPRKNIVNQSNNNPQGSKPPFYPQLTYLPQPPNLNYNRNQNAYRQPPFNPNYHRNYGQYNAAIPARPTGPKPQPRAEPMDVDRTIRSRAINYMNRPEPNRMLGKGPPAETQGPHRPPKYQRNFHIEPQESDLSNYEQILDSENNVYEQSLTDYVEEHEQYENEEQEIVDLTDIHFLD